MCDTLVWSFDAITGLPWLELVKAFAAAVTPIIAFVALQNWRRQDKAKREAEFLDQLTEETHAFIAGMSVPATLVEASKIGMHAHIPTWEGGDQSVRGAILYIEKRGTDHAKLLMESLALVQLSMVRLRSLVAKGQVFKFQGYQKCQDAVAMLTWQFDRSQALMAFIASPHWNWENTQVLEQLKRIMEIDADDIRKHLAQHNVAIIEFAATAYGRIYG